METLCGIIRRFNWINFKHPASTPADLRPLVPQRQANSVMLSPMRFGRFRMLRVLRKWGGLCGLKLQGKLRTFDFPYYKTDRNRPLVIPVFGGKSSRDLVQISAYIPCKPMGGPCSGISWRLWIALGPRDKIAGAAFKNQLPLRLQLERPVFPRQGRLARICRRRHLNTYDSAILAREERSLGGS